MDLLNIEEYYKTLTEYADLNIDWDLLRDKTFLITGATGMIGKCLIDLIMYKNITDDLNCTVIALGRNKEKAVNRLGAYFNDRNFDFIEVDVNKPFDILHNNKVKGNDGSNLLLYIMLFNPILLGCCCSWALNLNIFFLFCF